MFAEGDVLKNKHTGGIVTVTDVLHIKSAKNPVLQVLDAEGQVFRLDEPSASHWALAKPVVEGGEEE